VCLSQLLDQQFNAGADEPACRFLLHPKLLWSLQQLTATINCNYYCSKICNWVMPYLLSEFALQRNLHAMTILRARASIAIAHISYGNSVCPSVLVSRPGIDSQPRWDRDFGFSSYDSLESLVSSILRQNFMPLGEGGPPDSRTRGERWVNASLSRTPSVKAFARWRHATNCDGDGDWYLYINLAWTPQLLAKLLNGFGNGLDRWNSYPTSFPSVPDSHIHT